MSVVTNKVAGLCPIRRQRAQAEARGAFARVGERTEAQRLFETGGLRWRFPRSSSPCEAAIVNTGGGVAGGDSYRVSLELGERAEVEATTPSAERIYRSDGPAAAIATRLELAPGARLFWLPQETLMFEGAVLERRLEVEMSAEASVVIAETLVFGRLAMGESRIDASLRDSWRVRRDGRLVFADETRLEHAGAALERKAVGAGARARGDDRRRGAQYRGPPARFAGGARGCGRRRRSRRQRLRRPDRRPPRLPFALPIARRAHRVHCRARRTQASALGMSEGAEFAGRMTDMRRDEGP